MFYPHYKSIKDRLTSQVSALKDIQWFNEQYDSPALSECLAFIEFPDMVPVPSISKTTQRESIAVCVHILNKILSDKDGYVPDAQVLTHDAVADSAETALKNYQLTYNGSPLGRPLQLTGFLVQHKSKGWLVTKIFFSTTQVQ